MQEDNEKTQSENADLLEEAMPTILGLAREIHGMHRPVRNLIPYEDVVSEGVVGALLAARCYDPEQGPFLSYARPYIRGRMVDLHRRKRFDQVSMLRHGDATDLSMVTKSDYFLQRQSNPHNQTLAQQYRDLMSKSMDALPAEQATILRRIFMDDVKLKELREDLDLGTTRVWQLRRAGLRKMRKLLEKRGVDGNEFVRSEICQ